jgi:hypothetical protein
LILDPALMILESLEFVSIRFGILTGMALLCERVIEVGPEGGEP